MLARAFGSGATAAARGYSYKLGDALYLALTDRCTSCTMLATRGPGFVMPATSGFSPLGDRPEPMPDDLAHIVDEHYSTGVTIVGMGENDSGVTFGGFGEPTLRLDALLDTGAPTAVLSTYLKSTTSVLMVQNHSCRLMPSATFLPMLPVRLVQESRHGVPFRVLTNGLLAPEAAARLAEGGVGRASVALMSANPAQYASLMRPLGGRGHVDVCQFVVALAEAGVEVECTAVKAPGVNVRDVQLLSEALGATTFRARDYFA